MSQYKLSICIPVFNKKNFTISCLKDLFKLPETHEIIVVDNNSTDGTEELIRQLPKSSRFVYHKSNINLGFGKSSNLAASLAQADNIMFLNNDIRVNSSHSDWTKEIIEYCEQDYIVGPTMGELDVNCNFIREANAYIDGKYSYMSGWCLSSSRKVFEKLNLPRNNQFLITDKQVYHIFDEKYSPAYFEDSDLSMRAKMLKIPFKVVNVPVHHFGKITSKQLNTAALYKQSQKKFIDTWKK